MLEFASPASQTRLSALAALTGMRITCHVHSHVIVDDIVILSLDHPFIPEKRFASLLVRDKELAQRLAEGFETLWSKAMRDLQEIDFHPAGSVR